MSQKIVLGQPPRAFTREVSVPLPGGDTGVIRAEFTYRTRTELVALMAEVESSMEKLEGLETVSEVVAVSTALNAGHLMSILCGWDLDVPFNEETVTQLCDEIPGAAAALMDTYRAVLVEGREGN